MASQALFVGNMKGGVGKSTLACYLYDFLRLKSRQHTVNLVDADGQGSAYEMLAPIAPPGTTRHMTLGDRYDGVNMLTADTFLRSRLAEDKNLVIIDSGAGRPDSIAQLAMMCSCVLVPTSLSWADLRPTRDFIIELQERKDSSRAVQPHIIVVPNRVPPQQRDLTQLTETLANLDVIVAPGLSEISAVRRQSSHFGGLAAVHDTRFYDEFFQLGDFIRNFVLSGKLDKIYADTGNVVELTNLRSAR